MPFDQETLPSLIVLLSATSALAIFLFKDTAVRTRITLSIVGAGGTLLLVLVMLWGVFLERSYEVRLPFLPDIDIVLRATPLSMLFSLLSATLWFITTIYAIGYLERSPHPRRFFGFFGLCVSATLGVALAGNLITFLLFFEILTISTYPLVVHRGTAAARHAGLVYLRYAIPASTALLLGVVWLRSLVGPIDLSAVDILRQAGDQHRWELIAIFCLLIVGVGAKAALVPLHGWLPLAMVAPAPVSALLHAVAVVKSGAYGIVRIIYDVYGASYADELGVLQPIVILASITIIYGSIRALYQNDLKRRLAYSTVSQVSYIALGAAMFGPTATIGGIVHLVHQGLMKITLFFCAGNYAETLGVHKVSEIDGIGRRMPWTTAAFTLSALGMIGVPPLAGFVSKWYLALGSIEAGQAWVIIVLAASSLLNAAYFLPVLHAAWFKEPNGPWPEEQVFGRWETHWMLLVPTVTTAFLALVMGLFADMPFSALDWSKLVAEREFYQ